MEPPRQGCRSFSPQQTLPLVVTLEWHAVDGLAWPDLDESHWKVCLHTNKPTCPGDADTEGSESLRTYWDPELWDQVAQRHQVVSCTAECSAASLASIIDVSSTLSCHIPSYLHRSPNVHLLHLGTVLGEPETILMLPTLSDGSWVNRFSLSKFTLLQSL